MGEEKIEETTKWLDVNQSPEKEEYEERRKSLRELHYQFYKRWEVVLLEPEECLIWEACLEQAVPLQLLTLQVVQPLKKSIKLFVTNFDFNRLYLNCECHLMVARNFLNLITDYFHKKKK